MLAIVRAFRKFRIYVLGIPFKIITDCRAIALTIRKRDLCVRVARRSFHCDIGTTPFQLLFRTRARLKDDLHIRELIEEEWIVAFENNLDELRVEACKTLTKIRDENRCNFNKKRKEARKYREFSSC